MNDIPKNNTQFDAQYELNDRYSETAQQVFMTGIQALVRLPLVQRRLDRANGLNTAGFVTGYRGSPLAALDRTLWQAEDLLKSEDIKFLPAVNEDMAATAIIGTQEVERDPNATVDGVFSIWYGKGPGVDRSLDALKHANALGSSKNGGVLVVFGDDHGCISSAMPHQSEQALMSLPIPILNPACVNEYVKFGLYGFALSRFSGAWVGFKTASETVESGRSVDIDETLDLKTPDYTPPAIGLHNQWPNSVGAILEERNFHKYWAIQAFIEENSLDQQIFTPPKPRLAIVTTGKAHFDVMGALSDMGIDETRANELGITVLKIGLSYPLARKSISKFARGFEEIIVMEEKRSFVELQLRDILFNLPDGERPTIVGKEDDKGDPFIPKQGELSPSLLLPYLRQRISALNPAYSGLGDNKPPEQDFTPSKFEIGGRMPFFCSGCPHNTSTQVPEGSVALAGVGCHVMASWMGRSTQGLIHMGGEGANWVGRAPFTGDGHVFQNMGDGTYYHSGLLAIRQAVSADINITYKLLFNGAVGMTGGQPMDGDLTPQSIARQVMAEGVGRVALVSDDISRFGRGDMPAGVTFHDRGEMEQLQRELRKHKGVSVLIYDQMCAAEKRRLRKKDPAQTPDRFVFINEDVCEGCGDCTAVSNCLSIVPVQTPFGVKRAIDQSTCNKDFTCLNGYCPAFVTVEDAQLLKSDGDSARRDDLLAHAANLNEPDPTQYQDRTNLVIAGVGGTGIVTVGAVVTMAAHLEGKGVSSLDFMGLAQKGGAVLSHVKISADRTLADSVRVDRHSADTMLACDSVVATDPEAMAMLKPGSSRVMVNLNTASTADFILRGASDLETEKRLDALGARSKSLASIAAGRLSARLLGDSVYANMMTLGAAWQNGLIPVSHDAINRAIELNGIEIGANKQAFELGRVIVSHPDLVADLQTPDTPDTPDLKTVTKLRHDHLIQYQNAAYAAQYNDFVTKVAAGEQAVGGDAITLAVAQGLFKLMAYKDEYEVARLHSHGDFKTKLTKRFKNKPRLNVYLDPIPFLRRTKGDALPVKKRFGPWMMGAMGNLAHLKFLRATPFDPFGYQQERKTERQLITEYRAMIERILPKLTADNAALIEEIATGPRMIAGFGPVKAKSITEYQAKMAELEKQLG